jgi:predicted extracellular nuclease
MMEGSHRYIVLIAILLCCFFVSGNLAGQESGALHQPIVFQQKSPEKRSENAIRVMFYNVENLFNPSNDSATADEEYQPEGIRGWTYNKLKRKQINISKVILAIGGWDPPEVIGLCEVEDRVVLLGLINDTPLKNFGYQIVHRNSPDPRGIDVALLYRSNKMKVLDVDALHIKFPFDTASRTRDVLFVKALVCKKDTVNFYVCHWPSKFGGALATVQKRNYVASVVKTHSDSILRINPNANILIMGDLNDSPWDESVAKVLKASTDTLDISGSSLLNLTTSAGISWNRGTIKFREQWETIDQMIISKNMLHYTYPGQMQIFDAPFLLQDDDAWFGKKPFRTYNGPRYIGGFSDHLPVFVDVDFNH